MKNIQKRKTEQGNKIRAQSLKNKDPQYQKLNREEIWNGASLKDRKT